MVRVTDFALVRLYSGVMGLSYAHIIIAPASHGGDAYPCDKRRAGFALRWHAGGALYIGKARTALSYN